MPRRELTHLAIALWCIGCSSGSAIDGSSGAQDTTGTSGSPLQGFTYSIASPARITAVAGSEAQRRVWLAVHDEQLKQTEFGELVVATGPRVLELDPDGTLLATWAVTTAAGKQGVIGDLILTDDGDLLAFIRTEAAEPRCELMSVVQLGPGLQVQREVEVHSHCLGPTLLPSDFTQGPRATMGPTAIEVVDAARVVQGEEEGAFGFVLSELDATTLETRWQRTNFEGGQGWALAPVDVAVGLDGRVWVLGDEVSPDASSFAIGLFEYDQSGVPSAARSIALSEVATAGAFVFRPDSEPLGLGSVKNQAGGFLPVALAPSGVAGLTASPLIDTAGVVSDAASGATESIVALRAADESGAILWLDPDGGASMELGGVPQDGHRVCATSTGFLVAGRDGAGQEFGAAVTFVQSP